jgi:hypothetical protein
MHIFIHDKHYELREYLLEKFDHQCAYCGRELSDAMLEIEHMTPKIRGGTNELSNLVIACSTCNREKGTRTPEEWAEDLRTSQSSIDHDRARNCSRVREKVCTLFKDATIAGQGKITGMSTLRRVSFNLNPDSDADLLARIEQYPPGIRAQQIKRWIYQGLRSETTMEQRLADLEQRLRVVEARSSLPIPQSELSRDASQWDESVIEDLLQDWQQKGDES